MAVKASATVTLSSVVDVKSVWRYYKLQASTLSKPSKPTTNPPSGWTTTEPSYTNGSTNSLYFCDLTVFCDNSFTYSDVSLSSSYEAAKAAYNKAVAAKDAADNAQNQLDTKGLREYIIDLLNTDTYDTDTYYPVVGNAIPYNGYHTFEVNNQLRSNSAPSWSTHVGKGFTCNLSARMIADGCGIISWEQAQYGWIDVASYAWCDKMPAYIQQMTNSSCPVFYLRGGGKYYVYTDYACTWSIKTDTYTSFNESVAPTKTPSNWPKLVNNWDVVKRVTNAETSITNNQNEIKLRATKTEVTEAIDDIQVGGRNLLVNTNTDNLGWRSDPGNGTLDYSSAISRSLGTRYDKFTIAKKSTSWCYVAIADDDAMKEVIRVGGEFTLSFDVFCDAAVTISTICIQNGDGSNGVLDFGYFDTVAAEWTKIKLTGKVKSGVAFNAQMIYIDLTPLAEESLIEFSNIKLEKGNKATDWTPAPEDMLSTAEAAETYTTQTEFTQTSDEIRMDFTKSIASASNDLQSQMETNNTATNQKLSEINKYIRFVDGKIVLGETGNELMLTIQNDRVSFTQSGVEVAYFSNNNLYVKRAEVLTTMKIGNYEFTPRNDGGLALRKRSE